MADGDAVPSGGFAPVVSAGMARPTKSAATGARSRSGRDDLPHVGRAAPAGSTPAGPFIARRSARGAARPPGLQPFRGRAARGCWRRRTEQRGICPGCIGGHGPPHEIRCKGRPDSIRSGRSPPCRAARGRRVSGWRAWPALRIGANGGCGPPVAVRLPPIRGVFHARRGNCPSPLGQMTPEAALDSTFESACESAVLNKTEIFQSRSGPSRSCGKFSRALARLLLRSGRGNESPKNIKRGAEVDQKTTGPNIRTKEVGERTAEQRSTPGART